MSAEPCRRWEDEMTSYATRVRECARGVCYAVAGVLTNRPHEIDDDAFGAGIMLALNGGAPRDIIVTAAGEPLLRLQSWATGRDLPARSERPQIFDAIANALRSYAPDLR